MSLQVLYGWTGLEGTGVGFQNIMCVLQEGGIPENDFCAARPGGGVLKIMSCCKTLGGGGLSVSEKPLPHPTRTRCQATSLELGTTARVQGASGGEGAGGAQLYTIGQRGSQFQKFSEMTGKRVGFPWDLALILPINVGDQGDPGSRGMHTLVVFGGISTVGIATKTFWTVVPYLCTSGACATVKSGGGGQQIVFSGLQ